MNDDREIVASTLGGAVLGGLAGRAIGATALGTAIGGANGWLTARRRIYDWSSLRGRAAFVLDSTWALASTGAGLVVVAASYLRERLGGAPVGFEPSLSERADRMVHRGGIVLRRGFALTVGNVIDGAAGVDGRLTERRRDLVTRHEDVHVWQARLAGPLYPIAYGAWFVGGLVVAALRRTRSDRSMAELVDAYSYYRNPFEWHAYSRDDNWPPAGVDPSLVWPRRFRASRGSRAMPR